MVAWLRAPVIALMVVCGLSCSQPAPTVDEAKGYMLRLVNEARVESGLDPVVMGTNPAAQVHADASMAGCYSSHWSPDGLNPHTRYSLAGGHGYDYENVAGRNYRLGHDDGHLPIKSIYTEIDDTVAGWLLSPGHRRTILDPDVAKLSIGLAWDSYNGVMVQHFETDYLEYTRVPVVRDNTLSLAGRVKNGVRLHDPSDVQLLLRHTPPPAPLTRGQLARVYSSEQGVAVGVWVWPMPEEDGWMRRLDRPERCSTPEQIPSTAPAPVSSDEAYALFTAAQRKCHAARARQANTGVPWLDAERWAVGNDGFDIEADVEDILVRHGHGVYTVTILAWNPSGERVSISTYAIFHEVTPPADYRTSEPGV